MNIDPDDEKWIRFFDQYQSLPALWDIEYEGYNLRHIRDQSWEILLKTYRRIDPSATLDKLKQKVHNLRCAYRRELKRVKRSDWDDSDHANSSHLWCFEYLEFLRNQPMPQSVYSPLQSEQKQSDYEHRIKRMKTESSPERGDRYDCLKSVEFSLKEPEEFERDKDEADVYGEGWACCFRKLTEEQQLYAKKVIDEVLVLGQLEKLTIDTTAVASGYMNTNLLSPCSSVMLTSQPPSEQLSMSDENILYENHNYAKKEYYYSTVRETLNGE